MTPEEKANELIEKFKQHSNSQARYDEWEYDENVAMRSATQCAIICVEEIINVVADVHPFAESEAIKVSMIYWSEVLTHLKNKK